MTESDKDRRIAELEREVASLRKQVKELLARLFRSLPWPMSVNGYI